jgi:uncharacterized membrane protein
MAQATTNSRLETFCDGVFAIALTLLILDIKTPVAEAVHTSEDLWRSLGHLLPSLMAFLLSFGIILITWVNHHAIMKLVDKSTPPFIYANGFLLLTIVILPFATALLAEFAFTEAAAPAVVIYSFVNLLGNIGWLLVASAALQPQPLTRSEAAREAMERSLKQGRFAFVIYLACTVLAFWFPLTIALTLTLIYIIWLIFGVRDMKEKVRFPSKGTS